MFEKVSETSWFCVQYLFSSSSYLFFVLFLFIYIHLVGSYLCLFGLWEREDCIQKQKTAVVFSFYVNIGNRVVFKYELE